MAGKDIFCHHHYLLFLLLFGVYNVLFLGAEEAIIKSGTCREFFEYTDKEKDAQTWSVDIGDESCHTCNGHNSNKSWFHTEFLGYNDAKLVHAHLILQASTCEPCKGQYVKTYVSFEDLTKLNGPTNAFNDKIIKKFNSLPLVEKIEIKTINKKESHNITFETHCNSRGVSLVFLSEGGCIVIFSMKITYFYCKETSDKAVALPRIISPATESIRVNSSCSEDTVSSGGEAFGLCYSDGTWSVRSPCSCKKGFALESNGCKSCQEGTYKDHIGNGRCFPCPSHSGSSNGIKCECEQGYHRFVGENYTHACHGIPSAVESIGFEKSDNFVKLKWFPPSRAGGDGVFYDIDCFECKGDGCKDPCQNEIYDPSKSYLTQLNVKVENLEPNTTYEFVIYSKNANSYRISREEWESARKTIKTSTSETGQGIPSAVRNIEIDKSERFVNLKWLRPSRTGDDKVFYDIECFKCKGDECKDPCQKEIYSPSKFNLTEPNVIVGNLEPNTKYEFVIYSKNAYSYRISKKEWNSARRTIETDQGIPSAVRNIEIDKSERFVNLKWLRPSRTGDDKVFYDIECFKCKGDECKDPCQKETYSPSKFNLTQPNVIVGNLEPNTKYEFVIYSKNAYSYRIGKKEWESGRITIETDQVESAVRTASTSGFDISPIVIAIVTFFVLLIIGTSCLFGLWIRKRRRNRPAKNIPSQLELDDLRPSERDRTLDYESIDASNGTNEPSEYEEMDVATIPSLLGERNISGNYYEFWEVPVERIVMLSTLGHGSFGAVKKAWVRSIHRPTMTCTSDNVVAVKLLRENATLKDKEDFMNELDIMKKLVRHRFVVQLLGCCTQSEPYHLILEYLPGGDLLGYLRKSRGHKDSYNTGELAPTSRLNETELMRFAWMVSDAMVSLSSQGVVHRDLAARNVLVDEGNICKVSDFGLAREGRYERRTKARLPVKWMAPEDLFHGLCTSRSDVWAYGILLWEIFTIGDSPYPRIKGPDVIGLIEAGYRMPKPAHCSDSLYAIMLKCWNDNPDERPAFTEIRSFFKEHLQNNEVCLDLSKYDENEYLNFDVVN